MKDFTLKLWATCSLLLVLLVGGSTVSAAEYPSLEDLYGRYHFSGEFSSELMDLVTYETVDVSIPATTDYDMVILPDTTANSVRILGFFGYGNGIVAKYDAATGTLTCDQEAAYLCGNMYLDMSTYEGVGAQVVLDGGLGGSLGYTYTVTEQDGVVQLVASSPMEATYMSYAGNGVMGTLSYAAGYTLTKEDKTVSMSDAVGTYSFSGKEVITPTLADATEVFDLTVSDAGNGKVTLTGLYGIDEDVEADYYEDGGVIVLPETHQYSNGLYWGQLTMDVMAMEYAPYLYVEDGKLVSPCSFYVYGAYDEMLMGAATLSFLGAEAVKDDGTGVASVLTGDENIYVADGTIYVANADDAVYVYNLQGVKVAEAAGASVWIDGLQKGIYIVKAGNRAVKVVVR